MVGQVYWYETEWEYVDHLDEEGNQVYETSSYYTAEAFVSYAEAAGIPTFIRRDYLCQSLGQELSTCEGPGVDVEYEIKENGLWRSGVKHFEWPLEVGRTWEEELSIWEIFDRTDATTELGQFEDCYEIGERTSHGWAAFILCPGIGIVEERAGGPSESYIKRIVQIAELDK